MLDPATPAPNEGRTFSAHRRVGLADLDRGGRVRLDAIARLLQDVAIDDVGGRTVVDSIWIHLGPDQKPARIEGFGLYAAAAGGRQVSTKLELLDPPGDAVAATWPLRATDVDVHWHINNSAHWQAVEHALAGSTIDLRRPHAAELDYREPLEAGDDVELVSRNEGAALVLALRAEGRVKAVARVEAR